MSPVSPGSVFPDRPLPGLSGGTLRLSDFWREGAALVAVGHGDCATTRLALPYVDRIHRRRGPGAAVVLVLQEDPRSAAELVGDLGLTAPAGLDEDPYALSAALGLGTVPTLLLVGRDGVVSKVFEGFSRRDLEQLARDVGVSGALFAPEDEGPAFRPG